jgi:4'-phosphopantetheinyl transferase EntD
MVDKRHREFAAGRRAARAAMVELGQRGVAIPMGPDRAPVWPEGLVGSISHTDTHCLAAVARSGNVRSLGLDLETDLPLQQDLWPEICTSDEMAWLATQPTPTRGHLARLIFSAKEAVYKAQYPLTGQLLEFDAFEIIFDVVGGGFTAATQPPNRSLATKNVFLGRFSRVEHSLATTVRFG